MHNLPFTILALSDFSMFEFGTTMTEGTFSKQVRFIEQKNSSIYEVEIRDSPWVPAAERLEMSHPSILNRFMATLLQAIEVHTEKYPNRTIRLRGETEERVNLYRTALDKHLDALYPLFEITIDQNASKLLLDQKFEGIAFLLKRKPIPFITIHSSRTIWESRSKLFGTKISIEIDKGVRVNMMNPHKWGRD